MEKDFDIDIDFLEYLKLIIGELQVSQVEIDTYLLNRLIGLLSGGIVTGDSPSSIEEQLNDDLKYLSFYKPYYPYVRYFSNRSNIEGDVYTPVYKDIQISDKESVSIVYDFYKKNKLVDKGLLRDFLSDAKDHLKFISPRADTGGETIFIKCTGEWFCLVPDEKNISKVTTLVHETTHIFDWFTNPEFINSYLIKEFNALFREMIASDYFAQVLGLGNDNLKHRYYIHSLIKRYADDVYFRTQILHMLSKSKLPNASAKIYDTFGKGYLAYLTQDTIVDNYVYQIAYLIAIELYTLYQEDNDKALWLADYILCYGDDYNIIDILKRNDIELNKNSLDYEKKLKLGLNI